MCSDNSNWAGVGSGSGGDRATFDWDGFQQPSTAVAEAVASVTDRDPTELEPIHESIDADALNKLIDPMGDGPIQLSFRYEGVDVTLDSHHGIEIRPAPDDELAE